MDCQEAREKLSPYLDHELSAEERTFLEGHLHACPACRKELQDLQLIVKQLSTLDELIPPLQFRTELFAKLEEELQKKEVSQMKKGFFVGLKRKFFATKRYPLLASGAVILLLLIFISPALFNNFPGNKAMYNLVLDDVASPESAGYTGLGGGSKSRGTSAAPASDPAAMSSTYQYQFDDSGVQYFSSTKTEHINGEITKTTSANESRKALENEVLDRKIIKNAHLNLLVDSFGQALEEIRTKVITLNGYIANESEHTTDKLGTKRGSLQIRIPQPQFEMFLGGLNSLGEIKYKEIYSQDVTEEYVDITGRLKALRTKEERLLAILTKSGNLNDVLAVENELANTRAQLESAEGRLRYLNNQTDYSTIMIDLEQASVSTQQVSASGLKGVGQRSKAAFIEAINNILVGLGKLVVFVCAAVPYLLILTLLGLPILGIWRRKRKGSAE